MEDTLGLIRENVIQGRVTREDEGLEVGMEGQPAVTELIGEAIVRGISADDIINRGLTAGMVIEDLA